MMAQKEWTEEDKKFWLCGHCENKLENCECGNMQDTFEISELQRIFGTKDHPCTIKVEMNEVKIENAVLCLWDTDFAKLQEMKFMITYLLSSYPSHRVELERF